MYDFFTTQDDWAFEIEDWMYNQKPEQCPYLHLYPDLVQWCSLVGDNTNFMPIFRVVKDLITYGDDGYIILKNHLEWVRNAEYMRKYNQGALTTMMKTADQELYLQKQLENAGSLDALVSQVREGDFTNLPIEGEQRGYIQKAYEFLRFSAPDYQWLLNVDSPREWSPELREAVGKNVDERQLFWALCDVRRILRYGWSYFVKSLFIAKGLGKDQLTLSEVFTYSSCDEFKEMCEQRSEHKILDVVNKMRIYDYKDWEKAQVKLSTQFPQLVAPQMVMAKM